MKLVEGPAIPIMGINAAALTEDRRQVGVELMHLSGEIAVILMPLAVASRLILGLQTALNRAHEAGAEMPKEGPKGRLQDTNLMRTFVEPGGKDVVLEFSGTDDLPQSVRLSADLLPRLRSELKRTEDAARRMRMKR